ncbi:MAG: STAS domain-containing protein [Terriglobales bacterium]
MDVPVLKQGAFLIATIQAALNDADLNKLRRSLVEQVGRYRSRGVIVDVTSLDVLDSFAARTLRDIAHMTGFRGAETVIVGIHPDLAFAMVQLGLTLEGVATALDLEEGLAYLNERTRRLGAVRPGTYRASALRPAPSAVRPARPLALTRPGGLLPQEAPRDRRRDRENPGAPGANRDTRREIP